METIDLKEILDGELIDSPPLNESEKHEFATALTNALVARFQEYGEPDAEWDRITDNYLQYVMDNFPLEIIVGVMILAVRIHGVTFNAETDTFYEFFELVSPWLAGGYENKGVYIGDGKWDKEWKPSVPKNLVAGSGGHFTLRDHNMPKKNQ